MKRLTITFVCSLFLLILFVPQVVIAEEQKALSTSRFVEISYKDSDGNILQTCGNKKAAFSQSYVSIGISKLTVNKNDPLIKRIFNTDRNAFGAANLKANYNNQPLTISKIGKPRMLKSSDSSVDMGIEWGMLDRIPWVLKNANLEIRLGYTSDSTVIALIDAFSSITSAIPDYTISSSLAAGFAITSAADKLLFGPDRAIDLMNAQRDLPLLAGQLCEGYYAIFSAENNSSYEKYYKGNVVWTGKDLEFNAQPINDVSYAVISVNISDRFYPSPQDSINDSTRSWSSKYREVMTSLFDLVWIYTPEEIKEKEKSIKSNLLEARTLLGADLDLIQQEKQEIHEYVLSEATNKLASLRKRIDEQNNITKASTEEAIMSAINTNTKFVDVTSVSMAERIISDPDNNIPNFDKNVAPNLKTAINNIESVISIK